MSRSMLQLASVRAPKAGRGAQILISDATPVEYGEPLIILE